MANNSKVKKHSIAIRRVANMLKIVGAWLVIAAMIIEAPMTLAAATAEQGFFGITNNYGQEGVLPDIGDQDVLDEFVGPDIAHLEARLLELSAEWHTLNQALISTDGNLANARETTRRYERRVIEAETRRDRARRESIDDGRAQAGDTTPRIRAIDSQLNNLYNEVAEERSRSRAATTRQLNYETKRENILQALLNIEAAMDNIQAQKYFAWEEFEAAKGPEDIDPDCDDPEYIEWECEHCDEIDRLIGLGYFPLGYDEECLACLLAGADYDELEYLLSMSEEYDAYFEPCGDEVCYCLEPEYDMARDYSAYIDEYGNFWYGLDRSDVVFDNVAAMAEFNEFWYGEDYVPTMASTFESIAPTSATVPARMSDAEINTHATRNAGTPTVITNATDLIAFMQATTVPWNDDAGHFVVTPGITITLTATQAGTVAQGRPGVFTGVFDGQGATIGGFRFRPNNVAHQGIGFIQQAGHGAVIRNVTIASAGPATAATSGSVAAADRTWHDTLRNASSNTALANQAWRTAQTGIGIVVGRTSNAGAPEGGAVVTIDNVSLTRWHQMSQAEGRTAQATKSIGGLVGIVGPNTTLNIRDAHIQNLTVTAHWDSSNSGGSAWQNFQAMIRVAGGFVGAVEGGTVNVVTGSNRTTNQVNIDMRAYQRSTTAAPHVASGIGFGGGIVGFVYSGDAFIEDSLVLSTRNAADPIRAVHIAGGIVGGGNDPRSIIVLTDVENRASLHVNAAGGAHTIFGGVGGLVGRSAGILHITDSSNIAEVRHQNNNAIIGGLVGDTGPASSTFITNSFSSGLLRNTHTGSGDIVTVQTGAAIMGGIIGQARGGLTITNTHNNHWINRETANNNLGTSVGGIIGRLHPSAGRPIELINVTNNANVRSGQNGNGSVGGIIGEIMPSLGGRPSITLTNVRNTPGPATGQGVQGISGGRHSGGFIGWNRSADVTIVNNEGTGAVNTAPVAAGIVSGTSGAARHSVAGGIIGRSDGADLTILDARDATTPTNQGNVTISFGNANGARDGHGGGIVGRIGNTRATLTGVSNAGNILVGAASPNTTTQNTNAGGIVGIANANGSDLRIIGTVTDGNEVRNTGTVTARGRASGAGGVVGRILAPRAVIQGAANSGTITAGGIASNTSAARSRGNNSVAGGMVGGVLRNARFLQISDVVNENTIRVHGNTSGIGGVVGRTAAADLTITNARNNALITSDGGATSTSTGRVRNNNQTASVGGIVGRADNTAQRLTINRATNTAEIRARADNNRTGGIVGRLNAADAQLNNVNNTGIVYAGQGWWTYAGGIIGQSTGARLTIRTATNSNRVGGLTNQTSARRSGGIVGEMNGANIRIYDATNTGNVRSIAAGSLSGSGGIVGRSRGANTRIDRAMNYGEIIAGGAQAAGGIVGNQTGRNHTVRNAGNAGLVTSQTTSPSPSANGGTGGIIGKSRMAGTTLQIVFNRGDIRGTNTTGGIIGHTRGTIRITDFYSIGSVYGGSAANTAWHGNGIIGRQRDRAAITINNGFIAGRVNGFATVIQRSGTSITNPRNHRPWNRTTVANVYIDTSSFASQAAQNAEDRAWAMERGSARGNQGIARQFDTEMITAGFLPGISGGPWRTGMVDSYGNLIDDELVRTYPYFYWQIPANANGIHPLETEFFRFIRIPDNHPDGEGSLLPLMDLERSANPQEELRFIFADWDYETDTLLQTDAPAFVSGTRIFNAFDTNHHRREVPTAQGNAGLYFPGNFSVTAPVPTPDTTRPISVGLMSPNGVVGFEVREVPLRLVVRGYDPIWGEAPNNAWVTNSDISIISNCSAYAAYTSSDPLHSNRILRLPGVLVIHFDYTGPDQIVHLDLGATQVQVDAIGYRIERPIVNSATEVGQGVVPPIGPGMRRQHFLNVPLERIPFPVRVWVLESSEDEDLDEYALPRFPVVVPTAELELHLEEGTQNYGLPVLRGGESLDPARLQNATPSGTAPRYFIVNAMWGDDLTGSAPLFRPYTHINLMPEDLYLPPTGPANPPADDDWRDWNMTAAGGVAGDGRWPYSGPAMFDLENRQVTVKDLHIFIENIALPQMQFNFFRQGESDPGAFPIATGGLGSSGTSPVTGEPRTHVEENPLDVWYWIPADELYVMFDNVGISPQLTNNDIFDEPVQMPRTVRGVNPNNWVASLGMSTRANSGYNNAALLGVLSDTEDDITTDIRRANTVVNPGLANATAARNSFYDAVIAHGDTLLQGSNPFLRVGSDDVSQPQIHEYTTITVMDRQYPPRFYPIESELIWQWHEIYEWVTGTGDNEVDHERLIPRINVPLVPVTPPYIPPYEPFDYHTVNIHVYAYRVNADGTDFYLDINGDRVLELVEDAEIATNIVLYEYDEDANANVNTGFWIINGDGTFTAVLRDPGEWYYFDTSGPYLYDADPRPEINLMEANAEGNFLWQAEENGPTPVLEIILQRPRHNVVFEAGDGGTLSFGTETDQLYRDMLLFRGTTLNTTAHIPTPVHNDGYMFLRWVRVDYSGDDEGPAGHVVIEDVTYRALFGRLEPLTIVNVPTTVEEQAASVVFEGAPIDVITVTAGSIAGTHQVPVGSEVTLNAGNVVAPAGRTWTWHGWYVGDSAPAVGTVPATAPYATSQEIEFDFDAPETVTAVWVDERGVVVGGIDTTLTINNTPQTVTGQTGSATLGGLALTNPIIVDDGSIAGVYTLPVNSLVTVNAGSVVGHADASFYGWFVGEAPLPGTVPTKMPAETDEEFNFTLAAAMEITAVWVDARGVVIGGDNAVLTIVNIPETVTGQSGSATLNGSNLTNPIAVNAGSIAGNNTLPQGSVVTLNRGTVDSTQNWQWIGWFVGEPPVVGTEATTPDSTDEVFTFTFDTAMTLTAVWGYNNIVGRPGVMLTIENVPADLSPDGQTQNGNRPVGVNVPLTAGTPERNYQFFGWIRGDNVPSIGGNIDDWLVANDGVILQDAPDYSFAMPSDPTLYTAIWGNHRIVGGGANRLTFHFYDADDGTDRYVEVPLVFNGGYASIDAAAIADIMEQMEEENETVENPYGLAFWGWFTDAEFEAEDRTSIRTGRRRPTVGATGLDTSLSINEVWFTANATNGNIDFYAIFSLWGDVDDNDVVDIDDLDQLARFVRNSNPRPVINLAAADVHRNGIVDIDDLDVLARYVRNSVPRPIMGQRPESGASAIEAGTSLGASDFSNISSFVAATLLDMSGISTVAQASGSSSMLGLSGNIGEQAIWRISHEEIPPTATYVDVRVYLHQASYLGMGATLAQVWYDPTILSNPRALTDITFFDFSLLTEAQMTQFDNFVDVQMLMFGLTQEEAMAAVKALPQFAHAWVNTVNSNHGGLIFDYELHPNHGWGANVINMLWTPSMNVPRYFGHPFVYFRFDVAPNLTAGTVGNVEFSERVQMAGGVSVVYEDGSVTIVQDIHELIINNVPAWLNPAGQTETQYVASTAFPFTLVEGTHPTGWTFHGWAYGTNVPAYGTAVTALAPYDLEMVVTIDGIPTGEARTYTAIWSRNGVVGGANLIINNVPAWLSPAGQTETQYVASTAFPFTLTEGTHPTGWTFHGWAYGTNVPAYGTAVTALAPYDLEMVVTIDNIPTGEARTYTAIWSRNGVVGANLVIDNVPYFTSVPGQTPTSVQPAGMVALNPGDPGSEWIFLGWFSGPASEAPAVGTPVTDSSVLALIANPHSAQIVSGQVTVYTAVWGNDEYVGIPTYATVTFVASTGGTLAGAPLSVTLQVGTILDASMIPVPVHNEGWRFTGWTPSNPMGHEVVGNITFVANFVRNEVISDMYVLIRYFNYDAYEYGSDSNSPFEVRFVNILTQEFDTEFIFTVPEFVELLGVNLYHVSNPFDHIGDARLTDTEDATNELWRTMDELRRVIFEQLTLGENIIDVFFRRSEDTPDVQVNVSHEIRNGDGSVSNVISEPPAYEPPNTVFVPTPIETDPSDNAELLFVGVIRDGVMTPSGQFDLPQVYLDGSTTVNIVLVYQRPSELESGHYRIRHFIVLEDGTTLFVDYNDVYEGDIAGINGVSIIPEEVTPPDVEDNEIDDGNEADDTANDNEDEADDTANDDENEVDDTANDDENEADDTANDNENEVDDTANENEVDYNANDNYEAETDDTDITQEDNNSFVASGFRFAGSAGPVASLVGFDDALLEMLISLAPFSSVSAMDLLNHAHAQGYIADIQNLFGVLFRNVDDIAFAAERMINLYYDPNAVTVTVRHFFRDEYGVVYPSPIGEEHFSAIVGQTFVAQPRGMKMQRDGEWVNLTIDQMPGAIVVTHDGENVVHMYHTYRVTTSEPARVYIRIVDANGVPFPSIPVELYSDEFTICYDTTVTILPDSHSLVEHVYVGGRFEYHITINGYVYHLRRNVVPTFIISTEVAFADFVFERITHNVTFDLQGGSGVFPQQTVPHNGTVAQPATIPSLVNHTFLGWFTAPIGGTQFNFSTPVTTDITLYARWQFVQEPGNQTPPWTPPLTPPMPPRTPDLIVEEEPEPYEEEIEEIIEPVDPMPLSPYHMAYMIGYQGLIRPSDDITRAEVSAIFFRLMSDEHRARVWRQTNSFHDVSSQHWFNNSISTLANAGILMGYPDGNFRPNQEITRAEFAALVVRVMGFGHVSGSNTFTDVAGHWAANYIGAAYAMGWIQGFGDGTFRPDQFITRAQVAALVNRATGRLPQSPSDLLPNMLTWPDNMNQNAWYYLYIQEATNSNYYVMKADGIHKTWTALRVNREWWRLDRPYATPHVFR